MSWSVIYTGTFELNGMGIASLRRKREECQSTNNMLWNEILAMMAMTPPVMLKDGDSEYPYAEHLSMKIEQFKEEISANERLIARIDDCLEVLEEHPDKVTEG